MLVEVGAQIVGADVDAANVGQRDDWQGAEDDVDQAAGEAELGERAPVEQRARRLEQLGG